LKKYNKTWLQNKHRHTSQDYVKLHAAIDMKYRSIISFHFTRINVHEITQLEKLLDPLYELGDVYADSGYLSVNNCYAIVEKGGIPYIRPKKTTTGRGTYNAKKIIYGNPFTDMVERYKDNSEHWMKKYRQRSVIEAVFSSLKRRLGGFVTSIKQSIQQVEIALKIIVYNLMILVRKIVEEEYF
jgi:transposase